MADKRTEKAIKQIIAAVKEAGGKSAATDAIFGDFVVTLRSTPRTGNVQIAFLRDDGIVAQFSLNGIVKKRFLKKKK